MPERPRRPNLDERFSLDPLTAEEVLTKLLGTDATHHDDDGDDDATRDDAP